VQYLVLPRFLAMVVMLPALTIFGNYVGVLGGWAVCRFALDFNTAGYVMRALESATTWDLYSGMIKSVVFAWLVVVFLRAVEDTNTSRQGHCGRGKARCGQEPHRHSAMALVVGTHREPPMERSPGRLVTRVRRVSRFLCSSRAPVTSPSGPGNSRVAATRRTPVPGEPRRRPCWVRQPTAAGRVGRPRRRAAAGQLRR